jgi:hypothetical protein
MSPWTTLDIQACRPGDVGLPAWHRRRSPPPSEGGRVPFVSGQPLVRQGGDRDWVVEEEIVYRGRTETFVVEAGFRTDFASVPRIFTWLLPTYGRYTRPAILHDKLCTLARRGEISRVDADGLFRRSMRELGVPFLWRWLLWAGVRAQSVKDAGVAQLVDSPGNAVALVAVALFGLVYLLLPAAVILLALAGFGVLEWLLYPIVSAFQRRDGPGRRANRPRLTWRL